MKMSLDLTTEPKSSGPTRPTLMNLTTGECNLTSPTYEMEDREHRTILAPAALVDLVTGDRIYLTENKHLIGRHEKAFLTLRNPKASRKHCIIDKRSDNEFTIQDMSSHGTYVNGKILAKGMDHVLCHKDEIAFGDLENENLKYKFMVNSNYNLAMQTRRELSSCFKEKLANLDSSHSDEMKILEQKITDVESEKCGLKKELNSRLEEQENLFKSERMSLTSLVTTTKEQQMEAESKLLQMEEKFRLEKEKLVNEIEVKINENIENEKALQSLRIEIEEQYQKDREELEERWKAEIEELKEKLAEAEMEHGRLKEETLEVELRLRETERHLLDSELEQFRLHRLKVELESKLETKITDLTQESTTKDERVRMLEQKLAEKEEDEEKRKKVIMELEEDLLCSICAELFIEPTVLNCGHVFCKLCIEEWKLKKKICPMCRAKITSCARFHVVDSIINVNVLLLSDEAKARREATIRERKGDQSGIPAKKRKQNPQVMLGGNTNLQIPTVARLQARPGLRGQATPSTSAAHPLPSTSTNNVVNILIEEPIIPNLSDNLDPFHWNVRDVRVELEDVRPLASPVTVAAIDLTHLAGPSTGRQRTTRARSSATATSTTVAAADTTIDLTSP